jgi:hypothetical protein
MNKHPQECTLNYIPSSHSYQQRSEEKSNKKYPAEPIEHPQAAQSQAQPPFLYSFFYLICLPCENVDKYCGKLYFNENKQPPHVDKTNATHEYRGYLCPSL